MKFDFNFERVISNAKVLRDPCALECFYYECEDVDGAFEVADETEEVCNSLPDGIDLEDVPSLYLGNRKTHVYGRANCAATRGHKILDEDPPERVIFWDEDGAIAAGYRPCGKCMPEKYAEWKASLRKIDLLDC